jgi:hypothetical protein
MCVRTLSHTAKLGENSMKSILWMKKTFASTLLAFFLSIMIVSAGTAISVPIITQADPTATVFLDPPTINGTIVGQDFTVNVNVRDADEISGWQVGLIFDPTVLGCTGFFEGEFLSDVIPSPDVGETLFVEGAINNETGVITPYGSVIIPSIGEEMVYASDDGRLAYVNFTVIASGVSDLHLRDVELTRSVRVDPYTVDTVKILPNIIDVYTVVEATPPQTVVIESNSTSLDTTYHSGFYAHAFNTSAEEISFNVTGPKAGFANITIPKELLEPDPQRVWAVLVDGIWISRTLAENTTHTSVYFTYSLGIHEVQITTRFMPSDISITLSSTSIAKGDSVTISGAIDPVRSGVNVEIMYQLEGDKTWTSLTDVTTQNGNYSYSWTPTETGTYKVKTRWEGDETTLGAESDVLTLKIKGAEGIDQTIIVAAVAVIIIIAAIAIYFVKFRKPQPE